MPELTQEDRQFRRRHLCASEWAAALGLSPFVSPMELWARKRRLLPEEPDKHVFRRGRDYEAVILKWYREDHPGVELEPPGPTREHPKEGWIAGTADALASDAEGNRWGVEAKTARSSREWGEPGTSEVPQYYEVQCRLYMAIYDLPRWDLAVDLRDADEPGYYTLRRDAQRERELIEQGRKFWFEHVQAGVPPEPVGVEGESRAIAALYPQHQPKLIPNTGEIEELAVGLRTDRELLALASQRVAATENKLKLLLGDAEGVEGPWGRITWRRTKDTERVDWKKAFDSFLANDLLSDEVRAWAEQCIATATTVRPGIRRFVFRPKEE